MGSWGRQDAQKGGSWRTRQARWQQPADQMVPHFHADKPGGTTGERERPHNPGFQHGEIKPQNL